MSENGDIRQAVLTMAGEREKAKPLRWRTGPVPHRGVRYLTKESKIPAGWIQVKAGWAVYETDYWLPLSEILDLIGE